MKILHVVMSISRAGGGVAEVVRLNAEALRGRPGIDVEIAALADPATVADLPLYDGTPVHISQALPPARLGLSPGLFAALMRTKPDIVHVHGIWQFHTAAVLAWSRLTNRPYVVTPHGMLDPWIRARSPRLKGAFGRLFHNRFLRGAGDIKALVPEANCIVIPTWTVLKTWRASAISDSIASCGMERGDGRDAGAVRF